MALAATAPKSRLGYPLLVTVGMAATVGGALAFQHLGGYIPCALCLEQRNPYYLGIPVGILAVLVSFLNMPAWIVRSLLVVIGLMMLVGAGMGIYHAGVEWSFWEGPSACSTTAAGTTTNAGSLLSDLNSVHGPSCTQAALRILGLSLAGWNVVASVILAVIAFVGAKKTA